jgi:hypothetical protein
VVTSERSEPRFLGAVFSPVHDFLRVSVVCVPVRVGPRSSSEIRWRIWEKSGAATSELCAQVTGFVVRPRASGASRDLGGGRFFTHVSPVHDFLRVSVVCVPVRVGPSGLGAAGLRVAGVRAVCGAGRAPSSPAVALWRFRWHCCGRRRWRYMAGACRLAPSLPLGIGHDAAQGDRALGKVCHSSSQAGGTGSGFGFRLASC